MKIGYVKKWSQLDGWGFITSDDEDQDYFFHISNVRKGFRIREGMSVKFDSFIGQKGDEAENIGPVQWMSVNDRNYWNDKYISNEFKWDLGYPTPIFQDWSHKNKNNIKKKICIPGCGRGHDAIYLAKNGFEVYAFDFSIEAIKYLKNPKDEVNLKQVKFEVENICKNYPLYSGIEK